MLICGVSEQFGQGAVTYRLPSNRPTWCCKADLPGISRDALRQACAEAFARWSSVCDVIFTESDDPLAARFLIVNHRFDGPSGVLADCQLPTPGLRQQLIRLDVSESWIIAENPPPSRIELRAVLAHEMGHGLGLQHFPENPPPELMEPKYNAAVVRPQQTEAAYAAKLYGAPQTIPPPAAPGISPVVVTVEQAGRRWSGSIPRVA